MTVAVLLATRNGTKFLHEQLASLQAQTVQPLDVRASDDGSTDSTLDLLAEWARRWSKGSFTIENGPATGNPGDNFRALILGTPDHYDFVAFCDQDDIWLPDKLETAIARLGRVGHVPSVHCSRTRLVTQDGLPAGLSHYFEKPPSFKNALVQSLAGGNTMVLNRPAFAIVKQSLSRGPCVMHDWWTYQIVTGAGGRMIYSKEPDTLYRQHAGNAVGSNTGWRATLSRIGMVLKGRFRAWNDLNLRTLDRCRDMLDSCGARTLDDFLAARSGPLFRRLKYLVASGVYRQTVRGQISLLLACILSLM